MAMRPLPFIVYCTRCSWQKRVNPRSDVLTSNEMPEHCPKCGQNSIERKHVATGLHGLIHRLLT